VAVTANFLGSYEEQGAVVIQASKGGSAITKGDIVALSSNKWVAAPTASDGPFGVACETKASGDATIKVLLQGIVYVTSDGTINPNNYLMMSASTAAQVIVYAKTAASASVTQSDINNARDEWSSIIGIYLAKQNEGDGSTEASACADGDTIRIFLNPGGG